MRLVLAVLSCLVLLASLGSAHAQCPTTINHAPAFTLPSGNVFGSTAPQWQSYFASKSDANNGILCSPSIFNLALPVNPGDAANKQYVDSFAYVPGPGTILGTMLGTGAAAYNLGFTPLNPANNLSDVASIPTALINLGLAASVANTTALSNASTVTYPMGVWRMTDGVANALPQLFLPSGSTCTIPGGDVGSEVPSFNGKCWLGQLSFPYQISEWGLTSPIAMFVAPTGNNYGGLNTCVVAAAPCLTMQQAAIEANRFNVQQRSVTVHVAAGSYTGVNVYQNGPLPGSGNTIAAPSTPTPDGIGPAVLAFIGAGKASTFVTGGLDFVTFQASNFGAIGVGSMSITSPSSGGINLGVQQHGQAFGFGGVDWGAATFASIWAEDGGYILLMGADTTEVSNATEIGCSGSGTEIQAIGGSFQYTLTMSPTGLTFNQFIDEANGCDLDITGTTNFPGSPVITGSPLVAYAGARFFNQTGIDVATLLPTGSDPITLINDSLIYPAELSEVAAGCSTCGSGATTVVHGNTKSGYIVITAGTAPTGQGSVAINNFVQVIQDSGAHASCSAWAIDNGTFTGIWGNLANFQVNPPVISGNLWNLTFNFANLATSGNTVVTADLTNGDTYGIGYSCPTN